MSAIVKRSRDEGGAETPPSVSLSDASMSAANRYASAGDLTPDALLQIWRSIPVERQEAIGVKLMAGLLGELVAADDGLISTEAERDAACTLHHDAIQELYRLAEAALPQVLHYYPEGYNYEVHDRAGKVIGTVEMVEGGHECAAHDTHQFRPTSRQRRVGPKVEGELSACLPDWVKNIVADGGWFGAMLPDGRRYPDDFTSITNNDGGASGLGTCPASLPNRAMNPGQSTTSLECHDEQ